MLRASFTGLYSYSSVPARLVFKLFSFTHSPDFKSLLACPIGYPYLIMSVPSVASLMRTLCPAGVSWSSSIVLPSTSMVSPLLIGRRHTTTESAGLILRNAACFIMILFLLFVFCLSFISSCDVLYAFALIEVDILLCKYFDRHVVYWFYFLFQYDGMEKSIYA